MSGAEPWTEGPEPERYVTRDELAELMGVSVPTIDRMRREGMPHVTWGRRLVRFRPSIAMAWAGAQSHVSRDSAPPRTEPR